MGIPRNYSILGVRKVFLGFMPTTEIGLGISDKWEETQNNAEGLQT